VFGCTCFVDIQTSHRDKLDSRAAKGIFLGYSSTQKGYKCYHPLSKKLFISRDVCFKENSLYFKNKNQQDDLTKLFPQPNATSTDLSLSADRQLVADNISSFPNGVAVNKGNVSPANTHSEHSPGDSQVDDSSNHGKHLSTTTADIHSDSRVVIPIILDFEDDSSNQSPQPHLQHPLGIPITMDSEEVSEGDFVN